VERACYYISRLLYEKLGRVRLGFLVVSPFRIACVFLHVERGRSSKRVWRSPRIIYTYYMQHEPRAKQYDPFGSGAFGLHNDAF
jgi:hypothetical protein